MLRLALRQTEGLIGSIIALLGLDLAVPDHATLSCRAAALEVTRPPSGARPVHLLVDSTGLQLCGPGEWLVAKHGTRTRRAWRKLHLGVDADTGRIVAAALTGSDVDDATQVTPLLDQVDGSIASFTADGAYDRDGVYGQVAARHPDAAVAIPHRSSAVPSDMAETAPTQRDRHLQRIAAGGRTSWQKVSGYNWRALVEADISRFKRVIGDGLRSRTDSRRAVEVAIAVGVLNRMLDLGRPEYVRVVKAPTREGRHAFGPLIPATQSRHRLRELPPQRGTLAGQHRAGVERRAGAGGGPGRVGAPLLRRDDVLRVWPSRKVVTQ